MAEVLLADDDPAVLESLERLLVGLGHGVVLAGTAAEAIRALRTGSYDLLVTDIQMPGNDRLQMLSEHLGLFETVPVIVITAHPSVDTAVEAVRLPVVDYLIKPIDPPSFLERVDRALALSRSLVERRHAGGPEDCLSGLTSEEIEALSPRERELLIELARGHMPGELADRLHISPHTVRNHFKSIYQKLEVTSQVQLMHRLLVQR